MKRDFAHKGHRFFFAVAALVLVFSGGCTRAPEKQMTVMHAQSFEWKAHEGAHIKVLLNDHPWINVLLFSLKEFYERTGITVEFEKYPEEQFRVKQLVDMMSGIPEFDVSMIMPGQSLRKFIKEGWLMPLDQFMQSEATLCPGFDASDIFEHAMETGKSDGVCYTLPFIYETSLLAYNKVIFKQFGLSPPRTLEELESTCRHVYEKSGGALYGITLRGKGATATSQWIDFLHSYGGEWLDKAGTAAVASPLAVKATDLYGRILRLYGPKDASNNSWYENIMIFMRGKAAMIYDANVFCTEYENPGVSKIAGNVGYTMIPSGPGGSVPHVSTWALAVSSRTNNREAAWYFIQWATGKEMALREMETGLPAARASAWKSVRARNNNFNSEWMAASQKSYSLASPQWNPPVISVPECRDAMGEAIIASILGEDVTRACTGAAAKIDKIMRGEQ
jgi:multiple sugar transport system substrate-binding protein